MGRKQTFLLCEHCKNIVGMIENKGVPVSCCGQKMTELVPNTVDASNEKHLPEVTMTGNTLDVQVGSVAHPMEEGHHIQFIYVETESGGQRKGLKPGDKPNARFCFADEKPIAVYEYCNLHGLWKVEIK